MKLPFIVASLLGNGLLIAILVSRPALAPVAFRDYFATSSARPAVAPVARAAKPASPAPAGNAWSRLHSDDPATFIARLRAAGFPPALIRALVSSELSARYEERMRAIMDPDPTAPFWKMRPTSMSYGDKRLDDMRLLQQERARVLRELFKDDFFATQDVTTAQRRQYGNLTRNQIDAVQRIEEDYTDMIASVRAGAQGVMLAEDREKLALLEREKRADLLGVLSPAEAADYEMRTSQTGNMLRSRLAGFDASEAEYRAIYQAQVELNAKFPGGFSSITFEEREGAHNAYLEKVRASLGDTRFNEFLRDTSMDFQQLTALTEREKLGRDTALQAYNAREAAARESNRIFDDATLSVDQKRAALAALAQTTRAQLLAALGPNAGPAYMRTAEQWLGPIERGGAISPKPNVPVLIVSGQGTMSYSGSPETRRLPTSATPKR